VIRGIRGSAAWCVSFIPFIASAPRQRQVAFDAEPVMSRQAQRFFVSTFVVFAVVGCAVNRPFVPTLESSANWQLSEGCRVYRYGILTDPDCDILTGDGIAIQITRIRVLNLQPGQDNRAIIGIELAPDNGDWNLSLPYVSLELGESRQVVAEINEALVVEKRGQRILPEKLERNHQQYALPPGERRFFRLRFAVPQTELKNGFALRIVGLQKGGAAVSVPLIKFK
jgi:hypothetical protein